MPRIAYDATGSHRSARIIFDNRPIGLIFKNPTAPSPAAPTILIDIHSDPRGPKRGSTTPAS